MKNITLYIDSTRSNKDTIFLRNLPDDGSLFEIIGIIRKIYKKKALIITRNVSFRGLTYATMSLRNIIFNFPVSFTDCIFFDNVSFENCIFKDKVDFSNSKFKKSASFAHSIFEKEADFTEADFGTKDKKNNASDVLQLGKASFLSNVSFHYCNFYTKISFENTTFKALVDFHLSTFYEPEQFYWTDFANRAVFSNVTFKREVQFLYNKVDKDTYISFESSAFEKCLDISRANFTCNVNFWNISVKGEKELFRRGYFSKYYDDFGTLEVREGDKALSVYQKIRESYRIIKDNFYKNNDKINGLAFYKREMHLYQKELGGSARVKDSTVLFLNRISNNFGTNWLKAVAFTLLSGIITYGLVILSLYEEISWDSYGLKDIFKHFLEILNIAEWEVHPFGLALGVWGYLALFIGRIFIIYGYYQTIQAFRKFGKS
ncbi:pentapeptide repeat-containing protein [Capnocytophaga haemolytica]